MLRQLRRLTRARAHVYVELDRETSFQQKFIHRLVLRGFFCVNKTCTIVSYLYPICNTCQRYNGVETLSLYISTNQDLSLIHIQMCIRDRICISNFSTFLFTKKNKFSCSQFIQLFKHLYILQILYYYLYYVFIAGLVFS